MNDENRSPSSSMSSSDHHNPKPSSTKILSSENNVAVEEDIPSFTSLQEITEMRDFLKLPIFFNFLIYLFYRLIRSIILLESDFWVILKRFTSGNKIIDFITGQKSSSPTATTSNSPRNSPTAKTKFSKSDDSCEIQEIEIMTILARKKLNKSDISRDLDFMLFHSEFRSFSILENPNWQLYSISQNYAYFVEMPFPSTEYTFKFCDSLSEGLFTEAQRVARCDWNTFEAKSEKWRHFNGKVIALTTMLHSGSSTLCSLIQQISNEAPNPDSLIIYSNPDPFTHLAAFCEMYEKIGVKQTRKMLLTVLRYLCKDQRLKQTIIFRLRPSTIRLVPHFHAVAPHVMHVFMARDQLEHSISLFVNSKNNEQSDLQKLALLLKNTCNILADIPTICFGEQLTINMVRPKSLIELSVALICSSVINYKRQKKFYIAPVIYYENLITETRENLKSLFELCGLPDLRISDLVIQKAREIGEKELSVIQELSNEEKIVIEQTTQLLEFYSD